MHLIMILAALAVAWWLRLTSTEPRGTWIQRWQRSLFLFLFPLVTFNDSDRRTMHGDSRTNAWATNRLV